MGTPLITVLRVRAGTEGSFFFLLLLASALLGFLKRAGEKPMVQTALIKANSSFLIIMLDRGSVLYGC
jgi:hypothetical protein